MTDSGPTVLTIPVEVTQHALSFCPPCDVIVFSMTCHSAHRLVHYSADNHLWRQLFLSLFDHPRKSVRALHDHSSVDDQFDWRAEVIRRMKAGFTARRGRTVLVDRSVVLQTFITMIEDAPPVHDGVEKDSSLNISWLTNVLSDSDISRIPHSSDNSREEIALECRLRSYLAFSLTQGEEDASGYCLKTYLGSPLAPDKKFLALRKRRTISRCFVYDLRNYGRDNHWGPFFQNRKINWVHIEHLINVVLMNLRELGSLLIISPPLGLEYTRAFTAPNCRSPDDWAGVEGSWKRYVCFMDYRDLFAFNFTTIFNGPRNPAYFEDESFREATRLISVNLHLVPPEQLRFRGISKNSIDCSSAQYPTLYFTGVSHGNNGADAVVEGNVRMGNEGVALWQFVSIYDGHTQWSSEGVQIGNIGSAMGVVGVWTTDLHDEEGDPVGPFWLWKVQ